MGGNVGCFIAGIFGSDANVQFGGYGDALWRDTSHGERFWTQLVLVIVVLLWTLANSWVLFGALSKMGILRIAEEMERSGIDKAEHGGSAVHMRRSYPKRKYGKGSMASGLLQNGDQEQQNISPSSGLEKVKSMSDADEAEGPEEDTKYEKKDESGRKPD